MPDRATPRLRRRLVLLVVVAEDRLDRREGVAVDVRGVLVGDHELPLLRGQRVLARRPAGDARQEPRSAVDESPGIGRIAEQARDRRRRRPPPHDGTVIAAPLAARQQQPSGHHLTDHAVDRFYPQEGGEDEVDPLPNFLVGVLDDAAGQVAHQADRQALGQLTAAGLVDQTGVQPRLDRVQLQLRDQAFQPEDQPAIGRGLDRRCRLDRRRGNGGNRTDRGVDTNRCNCGPDV